MMRVIADEHGRSEQLLLDLRRAEATLVVLCFDLHIPKWWTRHDGVMIGAAVLCCLVRPGPLRTRAVGACATYDGSHGHAPPGDGRGHGRHRGGADAVPGGARGHARLRPGRPLERR